MKNEGRIVALDGDAEKIARLKKDAARMGVSMIESGQANLLSPLPAKWIDKFDAVFVDAPCSGTGTLRRNPEIKWRLHSGDIEHFKKMQSTILQNAAAAVKKEGRLVYCTCSVLPSENEYVIGKFLADFPHFRVERPTDEILQSLTSRRGYFQTFPHRHSLDGFFGAVLSRRI
jgi:16S rRNA (cytosine967-C5)-methyltransferase